MEKHRVYLAFLRNLLDKLRRVSANRNVKASNFWDFIKEIDGSHKNTFILQQYYRELIFEREEDTGLYKIYPFPVMFNRILDLIVMTSLFARDEVYDYRDLIDVLRDFIDEFEKYLDMYPEMTCREGCEWNRKEKRKRESEEISLSDSEDTCDHRCKDDEYVNDTDCDVSAGMNPFSHTLSYYDLIVSTLTDRINENEFEILEKMEEEDLEDEPQDSGNKKYQENKLSTIKSFYYELMRFGIFPQSAYTAGLDKVAITVDLPLGRVKKAIVVSLTLAKWLAEFVVDEEFVLNIDGCCFDVSETIFSETLVPILNDKRRLQEIRDYVIAQGLTSRARNINVIGFEIVPLLATGIFYLPFINCICPSCSINVKLNQPTALRFANIYPKMIGTIVSSVKCDCFKGWYEWEKFVWCYQECKYLFEFREIVDKKNRQVSNYRGKKKSKGQNTGVKPRTPVYKNIVKAFDKIFANKSDKAYKYWKKELSFLFNHKHLSDDDIESISSGAKLVAVELYKWLEHKKDRQGNDIYNYGKKTQRIRDLCVWLYRNNEQGQ